MNAPSAQPQQESDAEPGSAGDPIRVGGLPPLRAFVAARSDPLLAEVWEVPMLCDLAGLLRVLEPADIVRLRRGMGSQVEPASWTGAARWGTIHLLRGREAVSLDLIHQPEARFAMRGPGGRVWEMASGVMDSIGVESWRQGWSPDSSPPGSRLKPRGVAAPLELDAAAIRRIFRMNFPPVSRRVDSEQWHVRLPKGHDRAAPAGVVAWISPTPDGRFPPVYEPILDELGLIAVGADSTGNERPVTDRLQLVLDGIEMVRRGWLIDRTRVYISGFSGGGRCASLLQLGLPEELSGAVPVAGIDSYHDVSAGQAGEQVGGTGGRGGGVSSWPARMGKPLAPGLRALRDRRVAVPVGELDYNHAEAAARVRLLAADGIPARLDPVPGLGHALPGVSPFADAFRWVDEPSREARRQAVERATNLLVEIKPGAGDRAALIDVVRAAPWSEPAWTAAELLGYSRERFLNGSP